MSSLDELWKALRAAGFEALAPLCVRHGIRSLSDLPLQADALLAAGVPQWQLEQLIANGSQQAEPVGEPSRADLPTITYSLQWQASITAPGIIGCNAEPTEKISRTFGLRCPGQVDQSYPGCEDSHIPGDLPSMGDRALAYQHPHRSVLRSLDEDGRLQECSRLLSGHL